jgi:hypothetical protein
MPTKPPEKTSSTLSRIRSSSDDLISQIIELDTLANCARSVLQELPYFARLAGQYGGLTAREQAEDIEARRNYGRLQLLVFATAEASNRLMDISEAAGDRADECDDDGPAGTGQPSDPGSPGALTRGKGGTPPSQPTPAQPIPTPIPPRV